MKVIPIKRGPLMDARKRARIALELCAIAPDPPIFLTSMLDIPSGQPLTLEPSASTPEGNREQ